MADNLKPCKAGAVPDIEGLEFTSARDAIGYAAAAGGTAIYLGEKTLVVDPRDAERLMAARVCFAYLHEHQGRIVTVPVNG